jgi:hypothetical protein
MMNNRKKLLTAVLLGTLGSLTAQILPAQAQEDTGGGSVPNPITPVSTLGSCNLSATNPVSICDPTADVIVEVTEEPNFTGGFNLNPAAQFPAGTALEGTGLTIGEINPSARYRNDPVTNIDFAQPGQVRRAGPGETPNVPGDSNLIYVPDPEGIGRTNVASTEGSFAPVEGSPAIIKDLIIPNVPGTRFVGAPFPSPSNRRTENFVTIPSAYELDLTNIYPPSYDPRTSNDPDVLTTISLEMDGMIYPLNAAGERIEYHLPVPPDPTNPNDLGGFYVFSYGFNARLSGSIALQPDEVRDRFDDPGEVLAFYGYDITFDIYQDFRVVSASIPEPTTIISSLLLLGGGSALKLRKNKKS